MEEHVGFGEKRMTTTMNIDGRCVGDGCRTYIIAEIGLNHNGQLHLAKALIDAAVAAEVDAVKFQKRSIESVYGEGFIADPNTGEQALGYLLPFLQECELSGDEYREIIKYCNEKSITFLCSPWDRRSVDFLEAEGIVAYKTSSADLLNFDLLEYVAATKKPLIASTGMSTLTELDASVAFLRKLGVEFGLLHCNSTYPAEFHNINLGFMATMRDRYDVIVGYSGHERGIAVSEAAVSRGAAIIERHFTMDRTMRGPDHAASLEVEGLKKLVRDIRNIERAVGSDHKWISRGEMMNREVLGKSLVAARDLSAGEVIDRESITVRSPAKGVSPQRLYDLVGNRARRPIAAESYFLEEDVAENLAETRKTRTRTKWGFPVRFSDIHSLYHEDLNFVEFHLTDGDLEEQPDLGQYDCRVAVHAPEYWKDDLVDLCSSNPRIREMSLDVITKAKDVALGLRKHFPCMAYDPIPLIVHPGGMSLDAPIRDTRQLYQNLSAAVRMLASEGIDLLLENMPPVPWYFGGQWLHNVFLDADEIADFVKDVDVGICLDVSHAILAANVLEVPLDDYIGKLLPVTRHVHIADGAGLDGEGLQIGEGDFDVERYFPMLAANDMPILVEIWQGHKFVGEGFWTAVRALEDIVGAKSEELADGEMG